MKHLLYLIFLLVSVSAFTQSQSSLLIYPYTVSSGRVVPTNNISDYRNRIVTEVPLLGGDTVIWFVDWKGVAKMLNAGGYQGGGGLTEVLTLDPVTGTGVPGDPVTLLPSGVTPGVYSNSYFSVNNYGQIVDVVTNAPIDLGLLEQDGATPGQGLVWSGGVWLPANIGVTPIFANNGLSMSGDTVQLGTNYVPGSGFTKNTDEFRTVITDRSWEGFSPTAVSFLNPEYSGFSVVAAVDSVNLIAGIGNGTGNYSAIYITDSESVMWNTDSTGGAESNTSVSANNNNANIAYSKNGNTAQMRLTGTQSTFAFYDINSNQNSIIKAEGISLELNNTTANENTSILMQGPTIELYAQGTNGNNFVIIYEDSVKIVDRAVYGFDQTDPTSRELITRQWAQDSLSISLSAPVSEIVYGTGSGVASSPKFLLEPDNGGPVWAAIMEINNLNTASLNGLAVLGVPQNRASLILESENEHITETNQAFIQSTLLNGSGDPNTNAMFYLENKETGATANAVFSAESNGGDAFITTTAGNPYSLGIDNSSNNFKISNGFDLDGQNLYSGNQSGGSAFGGTPIASAGSLRVYGITRLDSELQDGAGSAGTIGQVPVSAGSGADWAWGGSAKANEGASVRNDSVQLGKPYNSGAITGQINAKRIVSVAGRLPSQPWGAQLYNDPNFFAPLRLIAANDSASLVDAVRDGYTNNTSEIDMYDNAIEIYTVSGTGKTTSLVASSTAGVLKRFVSGSDQQFFQVTDNKAELSVSGNGVSSGFTCTDSTFYIQTNDFNTNGYLDIKADSISANQKITVSGDIILNTAGNKIKVKRGANASIGTSTLVAGTVTVSTAAVRTGSNIFYSVRTPGGTQGFLSCPSASVINAISFVINSTSVLETSIVDWFIIN